MLELRGEITKEVSSLQRISAVLNEIWRNLAYSHFQATSLEWFKETTVLNHPSIRCGPLHFRLRLCSVLSLLGVSRRMSMSLNDSSPQAAIVTRPLSAALGGLVEFDDYTKRQMSYCYPAKGT
jgi:hypothetical protein